MAAALRRAFPDGAHRLAGQREAPRDPRSRAGHRPPARRSTIAATRRGGTLAAGRDRRAAAGALRRRDRSAGADQVGGARARVGRAARRRVLRRATRASAPRACSTPTSTIPAAAASTIRAKRGTSSTSTSGCSSVLGIAGAGARVSDRGRRLGRRAARARAGRRPLRAAQSRRGVAEQALAAGAARRRSPRALRERHGLMSVVLWGPGEEALADEVVAARRRRGDRVAADDALPISWRSRARAALMVSGDTGPTHIAAAVGTPIVGIYGPTRPARNGPMVAARRHRVAGRRLPVPSPAPLPARAHVPARHRGRPKCSTPSSAGWRAEPRVADVASLARAASRGCASRSASSFGVARARGSRSRRGRSLAIGMSVAACGEAMRIWAAGHLRQVARGHRRPGPYRWFAHPLYVGSSVMGVGPGDRVGQRRRSAVLIAVYLVRDADGGDQERGGVSARGRSAISTTGIGAASRRSGASAAPRRGAVQPGAGDGEPRVPRGGRPGASRCCCWSGRQRIMVCSGGQPDHGKGRLAQW